MDGFELAARLKAARKGAGVTQEQAAATISIPRTGITLMEAGKRSVSSLELGRLAELYGMDVQELLGRGYSDGDVIGRVLSAPGMKGTPDLVAALERCRGLDGALATLERVVGLVRPMAVSHGLARSMSVTMATRQGIQIADLERRRLGLGDGPIVDVVGLLEANGVLSASISLPTGVDGLMIAETGKSPVVVADASCSVFGQRFALAEQYGHVLLDREVCVSVTTSVSRHSPYQMRARAFAAAFLMPAAGLIRELACIGKGPREMPVQGRGPTGGAVEGSIAGASLHVHDVAWLAHMFRVDRPTLVARLADIGRISREAAAELREKDELAGEDVARMMGLEDIGRDCGRRDSDARIALLALEAFEKGGIDRTTLTEYLAR